MCVRVCVRVSASVYATLTSNLGNVAGFHKTPPPWNISPRTPNKKREYVSFSKRVSFTSRRGGGGKWETTRGSPTRVPTASSSPGEGKPDWWAVGVRDRVMELAGTKENWVTHMALRPRTPPLLPDLEGTPTPPESASFPLSSNYMATDLIGNYVSPFVFMYL